MAREREASWIRGSGSHLSVCARPTIPGGADCGSVSVGRSITTGRRWRDCLLGQALQASVGSSPVIPE